MELIIANVQIRQDAEGRYCLNDLHRAAGGESSQQVAFFMRRVETCDLVREISYSADSQNKNPVDSKPGRYGGTYVAKELVYAYAMWISPRFHLEVIRAYDQIMTKGIAMRTDVAQAAIDNPADFLARAVLVANDQLAIQAKKIQCLEEERAELAPKAAVTDRIVTAASGAMNVTLAAKTLQVQPKTLFTWLSANRWIYRRAGGSAWVAYQDKIQQGLLQHKVTTVERLDGSEKIVEQVLVTAKGLAKLAGEIGPIYA
ncbi:phage antirepressor KilAC domain-containing protein [Chromobacterium violaceum]